MDDLPTNRDPDRDHTSPPRTPGWVLVLGILALVLLFAVAVQVIFGIRHGPGLHGTSAGGIAWLLGHLW